MNKIITDNACLKRLVVTYNAFFWITGPGMIGLGIWAFITLGHYDPVVLRSELSIPAFTVMAAGGVSVLAGLLGCLGGLNQNRPLLVVYSVLMAAVCGTEVTSAILCFLDYDQAKWTIMKRLNSTLPEYSGKDSIRHMWDYIQKEHFCCGPNGYGDWKKFPMFTSSASKAVHVPGASKLAPHSCCVPHHNVTGCNYGNLTGTLLHPRLIYAQGCGPPLIDWLHQIYFITGWTAAGVASSMVLALSAVCCLKHALSSQYS